jgi:carbon starvation protein
MVALKAIRGGGQPLTEDEPVPSRIFAPSGMIPTAAEKEVQRQWDELPKSHAKSVGTGAH